MEINSRPFSPLDGHELVICDDIRADLYFVCNYYLVYDLCLIRCGTHRNIWPQFGIFIVKLLHYRKVYLYLLYLEIRIIIIQIHMKQT